MKQCTLCGHADKHDEQCPAVSRPRPRKRLSGDLELEDLSIEDLRSVVISYAARLNELEEARKLSVREPLVQEVLAKHAALTQCVLYGRSDCENEDAALVDALNALAEWKP